MARVKRAMHARKKKKAFLKAAKGFRGGRSRLIRTVMEAVDRARVYAYRDRKTKKRDFRRLWIVRINAAARECGTTYSKLVNNLIKSGIDIDRKALADLAMNEPAAFKSIVDQAQAS